MVSFTDLRWYGIYHMSTVVIFDGKLSDHKYEYKSHHNLKLLKE